MDITSYAASLREEANKRQKEAYIQKHSAQTIQQKLEADTKVPYDISDGKGNTIDTVAPTQELITAYRTQTPVAQAESGEWKMVSPSISLDSESGAVNIKAPSSYLNSDYYKTQLKPQLETLSQNYKLNHDYKYTDNSDGSIKTTQDYIDSFNKDIGESVKNYNSLMDAISREVRGNNLPSMTEDQYRRRMQVAVSYQDAEGKTVDVTDTTLQSIPDIPEANFLKNLETYNADSGAVQFKDLMENGWNREKHSDEEIIALREAVDKYMSAGDFSDVDKYSSMRAMYDFMHETAPNTGFFRGTWDVITNIPHAVLTGAADFWTGVAEITEGLFNAIGRVAYGASIVDGMVQKDSRYERVKINFVEDFLRPQFDDLLNTHTMRLTQLNEPVGVGYSITESLVPIVIQTMVGNGLGQAALDGVMTAATGGAELAGVLRGIGAAEQAEAGIISGAYSGTLFITSVMDKSTKLQTLTSALINANLLANGANAAVTAGNVISGTTRTASVFAKVAQLSAEITSDVLLSDPEVMSAILNGELDNEEARGYALEQIAWNVGGYMAIREGGKIAEAVADTEGARKLGLKATTRVNWLSSKMGDKTEQLRNFLHGGEGWEEKKLERAIASGDQKKAAKVQEQISTLEQNRVVRQARKDLGELRKADLSISKNIEQVENAVHTVKLLETERDALQRGTLGNFLKWLDTDYDDTLRSAEAATRKVSADIRNLEKTMGLAGDGEGVIGGKFSKLTSNYVSAKVQLQYWTAYKEAYGETEAIKKTIGDLEGKIAKFEERAGGTELQRLADKFTELNKERWRAWQDVRLHEGLANEDEIKSLRSNEDKLFGEEGRDYMRTQRQAEWNEYMRVRKDGTIDRKMTMDLDHYKPGSTDDFVDPNQVFYDSVIENGYTKAIKDYTTTVVSMPGVNATELASTAQTEAVRKLGKSVRNHVENVVGDRVRGLTENLSNTGTLNFIFHLDQFKFEVAKAQSAIERQAKKVKALETAEIKLSRSDVHSFLLSLNGHESQYLLNKNGLLSISQGVVDETRWKEFYSQLDSKTKTYLRKRISDSVGVLFPDDGDIYRLENVQKVIQNDMDFATQIDNSFASSVRSIREDEEVIAAATDLKRQQKIFDANTIYYERVDKLETLLGELGIEQAETDIAQALDDLVNEYVDDILSDKLSKEAIETFSTLYGSSDDDVVRYLTLRSIEEQKGAVKKAIRADTRKELRSMFRDAGLDKKLADKQAKRLANELTDQVADTLDHSFDEVTSRLTDMGNPVVDTNGMQKEIRALTSEIEGYKKQADVVQVLDNKGRIALVQVDPLIANFLKHRPQSIDVGTAGKWMNLVSRTFRLGQTGLSIKSFVKQNFTDFENMLVGGGAWRGLQAAADELSGELGQQLVDEIKRFEPWAIPQLEKKAAETGQSLAEAAAKRELEIGYAASPAATESAAYRLTQNNRFQKYAGGRYDEAAYRDLADRIGDKLDEIEDRFSPNNAREKYLRKRSYANGFTDAIKHGYSLEQARTSAQFLMDNATTNFSRALYHGRMFQQTVPYFGAAVNSTKSFWRLFSLDPVGVTSRMVGGLIVPTMALTALSLGEERNRKVYQNLKDYEKSGALTFVINGQVAQIPVPEELSAFLDPFRHFVEGLYGSNKNSFWELAANDILGFSPIDLSGFTNLDYSQMFGDPTWQDRLGGGISRLASQYMPPVIKSAVIAMTGRDPYTGAPVDQGRVTIDPETGESLVMDSYQGAFANQFANFFKGLGWDVSPGMAQKLTEGTVGHAGREMLDWLTGLFQYIPGGEEGDWGMATAEQIGEDITANIAPSVYDISKADWNRAISQLYDEKEKLLNDRDYRDLSTKIRNATSDEEAQKYRGQLQNMQNAFYNRVKTVVDNLLDRYDTSFDQKRMASIISLMNIDSNSGNVGASPYSDYINSQEFYTGKAAAIGTMEKLGFRSSSDYSIFGYYNSKTGEVAYNTPTAILDFKNAADYSEENAFASIRSLANDADLWTKYDSINTQLTAIRNSKPKLTKDDKAKMEAIQVNWNAELAKAIAPYLSQMTPEAALNNTQVLNYLYPLVEVPYSWETNDKGKNVYLGEKGNLKKAYYESWIKSMFKVNDKYKGQY